MSAPPTFAGQPRPDLKPTDEPGFFQDADGNVYMADAPASPNGNGRPSKLRRYDVAKMLREKPPDIPWVIDDVAARGHLTMLSGKAKSGKSYLAAGLAVACAHGGGTVAGIKCHAARILYIDAENGSAEVHRRVRLLGLDAPDRFEIYGAAGFDLARDLGLIAKLVEKHRPELLILDSYRSLWGGDENDSASVSRALDPVRVLVHDRNVAGILIHHANRAGHQRGSTAIDASVEHLLLLTHQEGDDDRRRRKLVNTDSRFAREADDRWLRIDADEALGCVFIDEVESCESVRTFAAPVVAQLTTEIVAAISDGAMTLADVARAVGRGPKDGSVRNALGALQRDGTIEKGSDGRWRGCKGANPPRADAPLHPPDGLDDLGPEQDDGGLADALPAPACRCERPILMHDVEELRCEKCGHNVEEQDR